MVYSCLHIEGGLTPLDIIEEIDAGKCWLGQYFQQAIEQGGWIY
jgi:hypothetical protein